MSLLERYRNSKSNVKVAVVGDVMFDEYFICDIVGISPEEEVALKLKPVETFCKPGGAANVATNLARMGAKTFLFSATGDDNEGNVLFDELQDKGVNSYLTYGYRANTTKKTRYITRKGRHLFRVDREETKPINCQCTELILKDLEAFGPYDIIVVSDYDKGVVTDSLMNSINNLGVKFIVDPKGDSYKKYGLPLLMTPNEQEAATLDKASKLSAACYSGVNVLITLSERGSRLITDKLFKDIPVRKREFGDPAGCGDAAIAGAAMSIAKGLSLEDASYVANAAGACAFDHTGVYAVTHDELIKELEYPIYKGEDECKSK